MFNKLIKKINTYTFDVAVLSGFFLEKIGLNPPEIPPYNAAVPNS